MRLAKKLAFAGLASSAWIAGWAWLIPPAIPGADALHYLAMVTGPVSAVPAPYAYRVGAPLLAGVLPLAPEGALTALTLVCLGLAGLVWVAMGRRFGLSRRALLMSALAVGSTQGWAGFFNNPFLSDAAGLLGTTAAFAAWACDALWAGLLVLALAPLFRETVTPMSLLWLGDRRWARLALAITVTSVPLWVVHAYPGMPATLPWWDVAGEVVRTKGLWHIVTDAIGSYHALWVAALLGVGLAPAARRRLMAPPLVLTLAVACALSLVALNTVRMFTLALPFMALAIAEFFEALLARHRAAAWALALGLAPGGLVWFPSRGLGAALSSQRAFQYLFALGALAGILAAWHQLRSSANPRAALEPSLRPGGSTEAR